MNKKYIVVAFLLATLVACKNSNSVELNSQEKELAKGNAEIAAQMLVRKAVLKEAQKEKYTKEEQFNLDLAKEEVEVNFFLQKKIGNDENLKVTEKEARKFYEEHKDELAGKKYEDIKIDIANSLLVEKQNKVLAEYYKTLVEKYKLNDILKKEYPELTNKK